MEEEEVYVEVDLEGVVEKEWLAKIGDTCRFIGLDSDTPLLELGPYTFQGKYNDCIGTSVFLDELRAPDGRPELKLKCHTHKRLEMTRCFLTRKQVDDNPARSSDEDEATHSLTSEALDQTVDDESTNTYQPPSSPHVAMDVHDFSTPSSEIVGGTQEEKMKPEDQTVRSENTLASVQGEKTKTEDQILRAKSTLSSVQATSGRLTETVTTDNTQAPMQGASGTLTDNVCETITTVAPALSAVLEERSHTAASRVSVEHDSAIETAHERAEINTIDSSDKRPHDTSICKDGEKPLHVPGTTIQNPEKTFDDSSMDVTLSDEPS